MNAGALVGSGGKWKKSVRKRSGEGKMERKTMRSPSRNLPFAYSNPLPFPLPSGFSGRSVVNNLFANSGEAKTQVRSLGWEDPLEKERQPTPTFLPGRSHGQRNLESMGSQKSWIRLKLLNNNNNDPAPWTITLLPKNKATWLCWKSKGEILILPQEVEDPGPY